MTAQDIANAEIHSQSEIIKTNMMDDWIVHYDRDA